jgi:4-amino-4-deoxy-L-arabinose transferase-like glycosyltransferase
MPIHWREKRLSDMTGVLAKIVPEKDSRVFWLSFVLCIFFCGMILLVVSPIIGLSSNFGSGNDGYIQLAESLVAGNNYVFEKGGPPVFHRPPLYPLFLVPIALFPQYLQRYIIVIPQSVLVGLIGMMIFKIACRLYNRTVAVVALLLFLINPWVYWNAKNPMTPILQTFLYLLFAYSTAIELFGKTKFKTLPAGLIIGAAGAALALTHAAMLPPVCLSLLVLFINAAVRNKKRIVTPLLAGVVVICLIAPWTYRNYVVFNRFIPIAGGGGLAYFNGNVHWAGIEPEPQRPSESYINASLRVLGMEGTEQTRTHWKGFKDIKDEDLADKKMAEHIKSHPVLFVKKVILNAVEYYFPVLTYPFLAVKRVSLEQIALTAFHLGLWVFAIIGILFRRTEFSLKPFLLLLAGILFYSVWFFPFATFIGHSLYTMGTIPFLCVMSAAGVVFLFRKEKKMLPS